MVTLFYACALTILALILAYLTGRQRFKTGTNLGLGDSFELLQISRAHANLLENALLNGLNFVNIKSDFIGVVSTPILSFYTKFLKYDYGIMISASHNPYHDNGIKIFKKNGEKLSDSEEIKIENILDSLNIKPNLRKKKIVNKVLNFESYKKAILKNFTQNNFRIKIALDCANGSVSHIAPQFFKDVGCDIIKYSSKPNGINYFLDAF